MLILIMGGSASGKSVYGEDRLLKADGARKYYLATMAAADPESEKRIERHRQQREGKDFITLEQSVAMGSALHKMEEGSRAVLLECLSNLVANEMFASWPPEEADEVEERILHDIRCLKEGVDTLIVIGNNVFEDGRDYDEPVRSYLEVLGRIQEKLALEADEVTEVVAGIPVSLKGASR